jgi:hypothetical protein
VSEEEEDERVRSGVVVSATLVIAGGGTSSLFVNPASRYTPVPSKVRKIIGVFCHPNLLRWFPSFYQSIKRINKK